MIDFWCKKCRKDFLLDARHKKNRWVEWYETKCPYCYLKLIRKITHRLTDPYYWESHKLRNMRGKFAKDLIQPGAPGYAMYYPGQQKEFEKTREADAKKEQDRKKWYDNMKAKYGHRPTEWNIIKKLESKETWH